MLAIEGFADLNARRTVLTDISMRLCFEGDPERICDDVFISAQSGSTRNHTVPAGSGHRAKTVTSAHLQYPDWNRHQPLSSLSDPQLETRLALLEAARQPGPNCESGPALRHRRPAGG